MVYGTQWRGYQAGARFLLEATRRCGIAVDAMGFASYSRPGDRQSRPIKAKSFEKLIRGGLAGALRHPDYCSGANFEAIEKRNGVMWVGGEARLRRAYVRGLSGPEYIDSYPYSAFQAEFVFSAKGYTRSGDSGH